MNSYAKIIILLTIFYIIGICAFVFEFEVIFSIICAIFLIISILFEFITTKQGVVLFLMFFAGFYNANHAIKDSDELFGVYLNDVVIKGRVNSISQISNNGTRAKFYFKVDDLTYKDKYLKPKDTKTLVVINDENANFKGIEIGDVIKVKGNLRPTKGVTNPSQFDYANYLKFRDVFSILYSEDKNFEIVKKPLEFKNLQEFWWYGLQKLDKIRNSAIEKHKKIIKSPQLEILGGIVFGNEAINPPDEVKQSFVNSGLLHLLSASGLNVALIFGIWWFLAQRLKLPYVLSIIAGMTFILLYTFTTGFPPSILRATVMILFVLFGKLIDREANMLSLIFFVGLVMLAFEPKMFLDVGFQLSFVVTIGLICTIEPICEKFKIYDKNFCKKIENKNKFLKTILKLFSPTTLICAVLVPLCAQVYVAPLQMYYFNTFTPYSVIANISVMPFIGVISFLGFIGSIFGFIPKIGDFIIYLLDVSLNPLLKCLVIISDFFSRLNFSTITTPSPSVFQIIVFWLIAVLFVQNFCRNFKSAKLKALLIISLVLLGLSFVKLPDKDFEIIAFDVGNADSFLIKTPKSKYILIDTGRKPFRGVSSAKMIINEYLKDKGIFELEMLIITHFDSDHSGGVADIFKEFKVKKTVLQNSNSKDEEIIKSLKENNVNFIFAQNNEKVYSEDDLKIKTFVANLKKGRNLENENSIVTLVENKEVSALFMGDCGIAGFEAIKNNIGKIDILKIGHHGAKNVVDDNMLEHLSPKVAVISVGFNTYNHPDWSTLSLLNKNDIKTVSTKDFGAIKISNCAQHECKVSSFQNQKSFERIDFSKLLNKPFIQTEFARDLLKLTK